MKTPDEIKKGMEHCRDLKPCIDCGYYMRDRKYECLTEMLSDALSYIQQLERERDALLNIVRQYGECEICLHRVTDDTDCEEACYMCGECNKEECVCCGCTTTNSHWDWEGIKED